MEISKEHRVQQLSINPNFVAEIRTSWELSDEKERLSVDVCWQNHHLEEMLNPSISLQWFVDINDFQYCWSPTSGTDNGLVGEWTAFNQRMLSKSVPITLFFNDRGISRYLCALSDGKHELSSKFCVYEETGQLECLVNISMKQFSHQSSYQLTICNDFSANDFSDAIEDSMNWLRQINELTVMPVPHAAYQPVYSTWYSFHQNVTEEALMKEITLASDYGLETFILDDGWQTGDNNRGYAYCGDWQLETSKIADLQKHVERARELGMKDYLLWYSVPYMGRKSQHWETYKDMMLYVDEEVQAGVLDPRFPAVRDYLTKTYVTAVKEWGLTGLKLDFIDLFYHKEAPRYEAEMSVHSLQEAVELLLSNLHQQLLSHVPDCLIEFRQSYIGPYVQQFGNIFRVSDCPNSLLQNRRGIVELRLLCSQSAVHSDMVMWHPDEKVEAASLQILNTLFGTLQLSVKLSELDEAKGKMVKFWLSFMKSHQQTLLRSHFKPHDPQFHYTWCESWSEQEQILVSYKSEQVLSLNRKWPKETYLVNASYGQELVIKATEACGEMIVDSYNCQGEHVKQEKSAINLGLKSFPVPPGGMIKLRISGA